MITELGRMEEAEAAPSPSASPGRSLAAALLGFFVITLDALVVSVALPEIRDTFDGGITGLQWVMDGYTLPFAALLLLAGTLADRIGGRRAFGTGLVTFIVSSAACALATAIAAFGALVGSLGYDGGLELSLVIAAALLVATMLASLRLRGVEH